MKELFPALAGSILWEIRTTSGDASRITGHPSGETIGLAQIPGQVGRHWPPNTTPVRGLYLVGADEGARGIGTENAAHDSSGEDPLSAAGGVGYPRFVEEMAET